jgi:hypothetical protein
MIHAEKHIVEWGQTGHASNIFGSPACAQTQTQISVKLYNWRIDMSVGMLLHSVKGGQTICDSLTDRHTESVTHRMIHTH